jgi:hypothetical protein
MLLWSDPQNDLCQLPAVKTLWECFARRQLKVVDAPADAAVIISEVVIGAGPICKARDCNSANGLPAQRGQAGMRDLRHGEKIRWIRYMRQCAGLDATSPAPPDASVPRISIINRAHKAGRSIVTAAEALDKLRLRHEPATSNVQLAYTEGRTFHEQARLLDQTDILVTGHGAVMASYLFLPACSVVIDVTNAAPHRWFNIHAAKTLTPLKLTTMSVKVSRPEEVGMNLGALREKSDFEDWSNKDKVALFWTRRCPPAHPFCADFNLWSHAFNYIPKPDTLVAHIDKAAAVWVEGQQRCAATS